MDPYNPWSNNFINDLVKSQGKAKVKEQDDEHAKHFSVNIVSKCRMAVEVMTARNSLANWSPPEIA